MSQISIDITTLENYNQLTAGETYSVTVVAKGNPELYIDSDPSNAVSYTVPTPLPQKGDIITARWGNSGTHDWRVLKMEGSGATVADITSAVNRQYNVSINAGSATVTYTDGTSAMSFLGTSNTDAYKSLNTANPSYYSMMITAMREAVQSSSLTVHLYYLGNQSSGSPSYYYDKSNTDPLTLYRFAPKENCSYTYSSINIRIISLEDIIDFFNLPSNGNLIEQNFGRVFLNTDVGNGYDYWLMNSLASSTNYCCTIDSGGTLTSLDGKNKYTNTGYAIPVFKVDISNLEYTSTENEYYYISFAGVGVDVSQGLDSVIKRDGTTTATLTFSAKEGYSLPESITVTGASYTWNSSTGVVTLSNPTDNVVVTVNGVD